MANVTKRHHSKSWFSGRLRPLATVRVSVLVCIFVVSLKASSNKSSVETYRSSGNTSPSVATSTNRTCTSLFDSLGTDLGTISPRKFVHQLEEAQLLAVQQVAPSVKSRFVIFPQPFPGCHSLVYYHIHKNGGGTIQLQTPIHKVVFTSEREVSMGPSNYTETTRNFWKGVYRCQQHARDGCLNNMPFIFSFLRDPLDRFLSGLGQILKGPPRWVRETLSPCHVSRTTSALIDCVLMRIENDTSFINEHLVPQSYELYHGLYELDITVYLMNMSVLDTLVDALGGWKNDYHPNSAVGLVENYPHFRLIPSVLTPELQRRICQLYHVDVLLLQETRVEETPCFAILQPTK